MIAAAQLRYNGGTGSLCSRFMSHRMEVRRMTTPRKNVPRRDLTGTVFGRLTVLGFSYFNWNRVSYWRCRCECGKERVVDVSSLNKGHTRSCGCLAVDHCRASAIARRQGGIIDGKVTKTYAAWQAMRDRCNNPNIRCWKNYGGRGIKVCPEWTNFKVFLRDMGEAPVGQSLDRIDNDLGYFAANCRWADRHTQNMNRRKSTHCRKGHEWTPGNTLWKNGVRSCRECRRAYALDWYYKSKQRKMEAKNGSV